MPGPFGLPLGCIHGAGDDRWRPCLSARRQDRADRAARTLLLVVEKLPPCLVHTIRILQSPLGQVRSFGALWHPRRGIRDDAVGVGIYTEVFLVGSNRLWVPPAHGSRLQGLADPWRSQAELLDAFPNRQSTPGRRRVVQRTGCEVAEYITRIIMSLA